MLTPDARTELIEAWEGIAYVADSIRALAKRFGLDLPQEMQAPTITADATPLEAPAAIPARRKSFTKSTEGNGCQRWTDKDDQLVIDHYPDPTRRKLLPTLLGRTQKSISNRAYHLRVKGDSQ